jgi:hypothetical protein
MSLPTMLSIHFPLSTERYLSASLKPTRLGKTKRKLIIWLSPCLSRQAQAVYPTPAVRISAGVIVRLKTIDRPFLQIIQGLPFQNNL